MTQVYVCDYCEDEIDPGDDSANLQLETVEQEPRWERHFCCTSHLINWINDDPTELEPHLALGD